MPAELPNVFDVPVLHLAAGHGARFARRFLPQKGGASNRIEQILEHPFVMLLKNFGGSDRLIEDRACHEKSPQTLARVQ